MQSAVLPTKKNGKQRKGSLQTLLKKLDAFGTKVDLTSDGVDTFKTSTGGILTLLGILCVMAYGIYITTEIFTR